MLSMLWGLKRWGLSSANLDFKAEVNVRPKPGSPRCLSIVASLNRAGGGGAFELPDETKIEMGPENWDKLRPEIYSEKWARGAASLSTSLKIRTKIRWERLNTTSFVILELLPIWIWDPNNVKGKGDLNYNGHSKVPLRDLGWVPRAKGFPVGWVSTCKAKDLLNLNLRGFWLFQCKALTVDFWTPQ